MREILTPGGRQTRLQEIAEFSIKLRGSPAEIWRVDTSVQTAHIYFIIWIKYNCRAIIPIIDRKSAPFPMAKSVRLSQFHVYCFHVHCFLHFDLKRCLKTIFPKQFKISNFSEREHWISKNTLRKYVTHLFTTPLSNVISDCWCQHWI